MSAAPDNIRKLPVSERIQLVEDIRDSIAEDVFPLELPAEGRKEWQRRLAAHRADSSSGIPRDEVRTALPGDRT